MKGQTVLKIEITDQERCKKQIRLEIPGETVRAEIDKAAAKYARQVVIPGFRRGHVPASVVKNRFRKGLREEVASQLIPKALEEAFAEKNLKALGEPAVEELKFDDDESIHLALTIETLPEFELAGYKGIPLRKPVYEIRDEHIDKRIDILREEQAEMVPVEDRGAQVGDIVTVDLTGRPAPDDDPAREGDMPQSPDASDAERSSTEEAVPAGESETAAPPPPEEFNRKDMDVELGAKGVVKEFTEALVGARAGESRIVTVDYLDDYPYKELAGRRMSYDVEVTAVRRKELPEIDDEFAQSVNEEYDTLENLRASIRSDMEKNAEALSQEELRSHALEQLVDRNRFDLPESLVKKQLDLRMNNFAQSMLSQGVDPRRLDVDWSDFREKQQAAAESDLRGTFILDRIAEVEN
ncbi:MAG: trigger factor, partial [Blastocatellia bacterium]|nr:trigger factor [Blastocatellia bacterium]